MSDNTNVRVSEITALLRHDIESSWETRNVATMEQERQSRQELAFKGMEH